MADTTITIRGDSSDAQKAIGDVQSDLRGLDDGLSSVGDSTRGLGVDSRVTSSTMRGLSSSLDETQRSVDDSASAIQMLGGAINEVNPALGSSIQLAGALGEGIVGLVRAINPWTLALGLAAAAIGGIVYGLSKMESQSEKTAKQLSSLDDQIADLNTSLAEMKDVNLDGVIDGMISAARSSGIASAALDKLNDALARDTYEKRALAMEDLAKRAQNMSTAIDIVGGRLGESERALSEWAKFLRKAGTDTSKYTRLQHGMAHSLYNTYGAYEVLRANIKKYRKQIALYTLDRDKTLESLRRGGLALDVLSEKREQTIDGIEQERDAVRSSSTDWGAWASNVLKAAAATGNFSKVYERLGRGGGGRALFEALQNFSDKQLTTAGALNRLIEKRAELRQKNMTGVEAIQQRLDGILARQSAMAASAGAGIAAGIAAQASALSGGIGAASDAAAKKAAHSEQRAWLREVSESYEYRKQQERELTELSLARARQGLLLTEQQRGAVESHYNSLRMADQAAADRREALMQSFKAQTQGIMQSGLTTMVSDIAAGLGKMAVEGKKAGDGIAGGAKKAIVDMAKSFGTLLLTAGLGFLFTPGMQAQGAGMMAAGVALLAIAGAMGAAMKGKEKSAGDTGSAQRDRGKATFVIDTYHRESPGSRARDHGERKDNAGRFGIDRGRAWA